MDDMNHGICCPIQTVDLNHRHVSSPRPRTLLRKTPPPQPSVLTSSSYIAWLSANILLDYLGHGQGRIHNIQASLVRQVDPRYPGKQRTRQRNTSINRPSLVLKVWMRRPRTSHLLLEGQIRTKESKRRLFSLNCKRRYPNPSLGLMLPTSTVGDNPSSRRALNR